MASNTFKGFVYGAVAAASYGLNPLFTLPLYADGVSADSVLFYRYGLGVVMLALLMKVQKQSFALHRSEVLPLLVMGMLFAFSFFVRRLCMVSIFSLISLQIYKIIPFISL